MDVSYLNPFIEAVDAVFKTMLSVNPRRNGLQVSTGQATGEMITSLVGLSGQASGVVALRFPPSSASGLTSRLLSSEIQAVNDEGADAVTEMVNMVAGSAKAKFSDEPPLALGLPTVVHGHGCKLTYPAKSVWLEVPFSCEPGTSPWK